MGAPFVLPILWLSGSHSTFGFIGYTHYFEEAAPSYFVEGTLGVGIVPDEFRQETFGGVGLSLAGGYEFKSHLSLRLDILYGHGEESASDSFYYAYKEKSSAISLMLTLNALAY